MTEKQIETILRNKVKSVGGKAYKWVSPGNDGVPDRIVILPNRTPIFVELKTDSGRLSPLQKIQIKRLQDLGQDARVVKGIDGVSQFFQDIGFEDISKAIDCQYNL